MYNLRLIQKWLKNLQNFTILSMFTSKCAEILFMHYLFRKNVSWLFNNLIKNKCKNNLIKLMAVLI